MKPLNKIALGLLVISSIGLFVYATSKKVVLKDKVENFVAPKEIDFAGEKTPLHIVDVRERLDREMVI
ncbi:MAG: lytic transglycosylase domain-containing protein, partial [Flavobacterium sp.]|nr:lytic transglycosylase domain-containing protein [Flavobacterium sp.]